MSSMVVFDSSSDFLHGLPPGQNPFVADHVVGHVEAEFGESQRIRARPHPRPP
jgi:hypothetical protein